MKKILVVTAVILIVVVSFKEKGIVIPDSSIRFRIIANSNSYEDQLNKSIVEDELTKYIENLVKGEQKNTVKNSLINNKDLLNKKVESVLKENNIDEKYNINIGNNYFPVKNYKGIRYDAGYYDSVVVTLGRGQGLNWWCVMYPPLCLVDENLTDYEYTTLVSEILNKYNM